MSLGHNVPIGPRWYDWWKVMELVFGFCFGAALGLCAWVYRDQLGGSGRKEPERVASANPWLQFILVVALVFCVFGLGYLLHLRIIYALLGPVLLWIALRWPGFAWHIAITLTFFAFARDLVRFSEVQHFGSPAVLWTIAVLASAVACGVILERLGGARPLTGWTFLFLLWSAVLVSWAKALLHPGPMRAGAINETLFTMFAMILTRAVSKSLPVRAASTVLLAALLLFPAAVRAAARILWPGLRNDVLNSGYVASRAKVVRRTAKPPAIRLPVSLPRAEELLFKPVVEYASSTIRGRVSARPIFCAPRPPARFPSACSATSTNRPPSLSPISKTAPLRFAWSAGPLSPAQKRRSTRRKWSNSARA